jgi:hypothetical protein
LLRLETLTMPHVLIWSHHVGTTFKLQYMKKKEVSPRLVKYFRAGDPSLPGSWPAPPRSPHSWERRWLDIECVHSFYILGEEEDRIIIQKRTSHHMLQLRTLVT